MDGGDALFKSSLAFSNPSERERERAKARLIARALADDHLAAANVGRFDLADGVDFLKRVGAETGLPWVSANIRGGDGALLFPASRLVQWGNERVALFGLTSADPRRDAELGIAVDEPVAAAKRMVAELAVKNALVVCLTDLGYEEEHRLAREVPGIHLLVGGGMGTRLLHDPLPLGSAFLLRNADRGRQLGVLDLTAERLVPWAVPADQTALSLARFNLDAAQKRGGADSPASAALARQVQALEASPIRYRHRLMALSNDTPSDPAMEKAVAAVVASSDTQAQPPQRISGLPPGRTLTPRVSTATGKHHVGTQVCRGCHERESTVWAATTHTKSVSRLPPERRRDPQCLSCHGLMLALTGNKTAEEPWIGCEACHGKGSDHKNQSGIDFPLQEGVCRRCHSGFHKERGVVFDFAIDYERIRCNKPQPR